MKIITAIIIYCFLGFIAAQAQNPQWVVYDTTNSGLLSNQITDIAEDGFGNKWIGSWGTWPGGGTGGGLYKFSSGIWTVFDTLNSDIPNNRVGSIAIDEYNNIWMGSYVLAKYDGTNWANFDTVPCYRLAIDADDNKWCTSYINSYVLMKFDGVNFTTQLTAPVLDRMGAVAVDDNGDVWASYGYEEIVWSNGTLLHFDGVSWTSHYLAASFIESIVFDGLGNKWLGLTDAGIAKFDGTDFTVYNTSNSGIPGDNATVIAVDQAGNKWIGGYNIGLVKFDGTSWTVYDSTNSGLPDNRINTIYIDSYDNKWIGTENGGIAVFNELGVGIEDTDLDQSYIQQLMVNPNPASEWITISINVSSDNPARLILYDVSGRIIDIIDNEIKPLKDYAFEYNVSELINGVYYIRLKTEDFSSTRKLMVTR